MHCVSSDKSRSHWSNALTTPIKKTRGCLNFHLRHTSRLVNRHYDDALRPLGLRISQFNILSVLAQTRPISLTYLANVLGMERSALARNLKPMARKGFVVVSQGEDKRARLVELAPAGKHILDEALPKWNRAQDELVAKLGPDQTALLIQVLSRIRTALKDGD
jgi:DNA-binding MarR family transcriptional regulator